MIKLNERVNEMFEFFARRYDIELADKMIAANPDKYKAPDGTFWTFKLESIKDWFAPSMTEEEKIQMHAGKTMSMKMGVSIKREYAANIDNIRLDEPGIWVHDENFSLLIDGWHRAFARYEKGLTDMKIWVISDKSDIRKIKI